jgi:rhamnosyltransferase
MTVQDITQASNKKPETAIIIRCRNEERWIRETLSRLETQTYKDFEVIVVDSGSTDNSLNIIHSFPDVRLVKISPESFTYPYAINVGIQASSATAYMVILSAHSLPIGDSWLSSAVTAIKADNRAMGVYGPLKAMPDGSLMDKIIHNGALWIEERRRFWTENNNKNNRLRKIETYEGGALGFTNALIRRDLLEIQPIDELYAGGGEDTVWMNHWLGQGYHAIKCLDFAVHHSHYLGPIGWYRQWQHWKDNATPQSFEYLTFRNDAAHTPLE